MPLWGRCLALSVLDCWVPEGPPYTNSLDAKLDNAIAALDDSRRGDNPSAANTLSSFVNEVEAQRGRKLTNGQADQLADSANCIIQQLTQP
jgi:hypothetical protein